jgi:hypothetical protein
MSRLKAYEVRDNYEGHRVIRFATNNATARREGACELEIEWEDVESCRRAPQFDEYAPGTVPPLTLIAHGWWFDCRGCGRRISDDSYLDDDGLDEDERTPVEDEKHNVYCSAACCATEQAKTRANQEARAALLELFEAKFPGAEAKMSHVYGELLEASEEGHGHKCSVRFTFPGAKYLSTWVYGETVVHVPMADIDAFNAWRGAKETT